LASHEQSLARAASLYARYARLHAS